MRRKIMAVLSIGKGGADECGSCPYLSPEYPVGHGKWHSAACTCFIGPRGRPRRLPECLAAERSTSNEDV